MSSDAERHLIYKAANTPLQFYPFPHFYAEGVFPTDFYAELQQNLPDPSELTSLAETGRVPAGAYKERFFFPLKREQLERLPEHKRVFWQQLKQWLVVGEFGRVMREKFGQLISHRFRGNPGVQFYEEAMLVKDATNYSLGPHTDSQQKVITFLFYLPKDESQRHLGTSIYLPKQREFRCPVLSGMWLEFGVARSPAA